jgi:hypothetical protein
VLKVGDYHPYWGMREGALKNALSGNYTGIETPRSEY